MEIRGKNILLIMPDFYHLRHEIESALHDMGASVLYFKSYVFKEDYWLKKDMPSLIALALNPNYMRNYRRDLLKAIGGRKIDILLSVGIYAGGIDLLRILKNRNNSFKSIIYFWDAFITWDYSKFINYFDYKYTFDRNDFEKYSGDGLKYLPLFYSSDSKRSEIADYDIVHIGTLSTKYRNRISVINGIINSAKQHNIRVFIRLYAPALNSSFFVKRGIKNHIKNWLYFILIKDFRLHIRELREYKDEGYISNDKLPKELCDKIEASTKCILDVNLENAGSAFRIISALARGIKVISTNKFLEQEDFYLNDNVQIVDSTNPKVDPDFVNSEFVKIDIEFLRIDNWMKQVLNVNE